MSVEPRGPVSIDAPMVRSAKRQALGRGGHGQGRCVSGGYGSGTTQRCSAESLLTAKTHYRLSRLS
jgi:hypothetical protein